DACARAARDDGAPLAAWYAQLAQTGFDFLVTNDFRASAKSARALEGDWYAAGYGPGWETDVAMHFSLASQMMLGEYPELARRVNQAIDDARRKGDKFQEVTLRVRFAVRHLMTDRAAEGRDDVIDAVASWLPGTDAFGNQRAWALWSRTRLAIYLG